MTRIQRFTLAATGLGLFMIFLDALIVNVALPAIQSDFHVGESGLQWVVTAYSLGMAVAIMSAGTLADLYGRRRLYFAGIALFTAASAACGMASSLGMLNFARGGPGRGGRDRQRDLARARQRRLSGAEAQGVGDRDLDRDRVDRDLDRADPRRRDGAADRLADDLHGQRPGRAGRAPADVAVRGGVEGRAAAHVRRPGAAAVHRGRRRICLRRDRGPAGGMGLGGDPRPLRRVGAGPGRFRRRGSAGAATR